MRKAIITGFVTGIAISAVLIGANYARLYLPYTFTANLAFTAFFFFAIVGLLWLSLAWYCRSSEVKWMALNATGIIASIIAAVIVSAYTDQIKNSMFNFLNVSIALFITSLCIAAIYYARNRNRTQEAAHHKNQELIF